MDEVFRGLDLRESQWTIGFLKVIFDAVVILENKTNSLRQSVDTKAFPQAAQRGADVDTIRSLLEGKAVWLLWGGVMT